MQGRRWANVRDHVAKLALEGRRLVVPAAALAELSSAGDAGAIAMVRALFKDHAVVVWALDDEAGEIAARLMRPSIAARVRELTRRDCTKLDVLIYATAIAANCESIATANGRDFDRLRTTAEAVTLGRSLPSILRVDESVKGQQMALKLPGPKGTKRAKPDPN